MQKTANQSPVVLTFDDAVSNHATFVAPLLRELGFGATFYICEFEGEGADRFATDKRQYMTWEQIAELHRLGFEIGNHTLHHKSVIGLPAGELREEIAALESRCATVGIPRPVTFAYPGGPHDAPAMTVLSEMGFHYARITGDRVYRSGVDDLLAIPSVVITGERESLFYETLGKWQPGEVIVYTFHGMPDINHPWVDTPPEMFEKMMRYLHAQGIPGIALRDLPR